jgi:hypothetical protein
MSGQGLVEPFLVQALRLGENRLAVRQRTDSPWHSVAHTRVQRRWSQTTNPSFIIIFRLTACGVFVSGPLSLLRGSDWLRCDSLRRVWPVATKPFAKPRGDFHVSVHRGPRANVSATACADRFGPWPSPAWPDALFELCRVSAAATSHPRGALSTNQLR